MAGITSLGVGSGLDAESIVTKLMAVEKLPLTQLTTRTNTYNAKISAFGAISSALSTLKTAATAFESSKTNLLTSTVSDSNVASLTTTTSAAPGSYQLEVTQLAKAHTLSSRVRPDGVESVDVVCLMLDVCLSFLPAVEVGFNSSYFVQLALL